MIYALASPELDLLALTPVFGNTTNEHVYKNLIKTFHVMEQQLETVDEAARADRWPGLVRAQTRKITVAKEGAKVPIDGEFATAAYFVSLSWLAARQMFFLIISLFLWGG